MIPNKIEALKKHKHRLERVLKALDKGDGIRLADGVILHDSEITDFIRQRYQQTIAEIDTVLERADLILAEHLEPDVKEAIDRLENQKM